MNATQRRLAGSSYQKAPKQVRNELADSLEKAVLSLSVHEYINTTTEGLLCASIKALREQND